MYCSLRLYRADPAMVDEITHLVDTDFADMLSEEPGFIDYQAVACEDGRIFSLTMWQDEQGARRSEELAADVLDTTRPRAPPGGRLRSLR